VDWQDGGVDLNKLKGTVDGETAAVVIQHPNYWGYLEDMESIASITHREGALLITSNDPISLALLKPPGEYGVDIATGEGQSLGNELNFGGPYLGIFTTKQELVRKIPGRIVGQTVDKNGKPGFVLTLQTREQHIRRERATSNICTNQGLNALAACIYLALMGKNGIYNIANLCLQKSHYLAQRITNIDGFNLKFNRPFFKEFVIETEKPVKDILDKLLENNIFGGINLEPQLKNCFLCCVTEKRTKKEIDTLVEILDSV
jgi:glycine dehydrogenase subunit 1